MEGDQVATLKDAVYGAAVGDALGVPYEFNARGTFECRGMASHGTYNLPAGTFSDDTSMMLATCDSVRENGGDIDCEDIYQKFCDWAYGGAYTADGYVFDIGNTVSTALAQGCGCDGERSNGNGSLMRIAPLAFIDATDDEIRAVSAITHAHEISKESCVAYVHVMRKLIEGAGIDEATRGIKVGKYEFDPAKPRDELGSSGFVLHTLDSALWCLANTNNYADCVLAAVNLGEDTDTTACVAGALAGVVYGIDAIPAEWVEALRGKDVIDACMFQ